MAAEVEVLAPFEPLATLERRNATLDGSVPLRVAQACLPLLEGNSFGLQVRLRRPLVLRARLGRATVARTAASDEVGKGLVASAHYLAAQGVLSAAWKRALTTSWWWSERGGVVRFWTGLCVRAPARHWLRLGMEKNRGTRVGVREAFVLEHDAWVPLVLDVVARDGVELVGEVATLAVVRPNVRVEVEDVAGAEDLARAHVKFYDEAYFAAKRDHGEVTRKYRKAFVRTAREATSSCVLRVAHIAGPPPVVERDIPVLASTSVERTRRRPEEPFERVVFANAVSFEARWDGYTLGLEPDREELAQGAAEVRRALTDQVAGGALLYLTKYFTPHPPGEPHFFVKPWAWVETSPGWSSLLEGVRGENFDVMRGVVRTDRFHAVPAVFQAHGLSRFGLAKGAALLEVMAIPQGLLEPTVHSRAEVA